MLALGLGCDDASEVEPGAPGSGDVTPRASDSGEHSEAGEASMPGPRAGRPLDVGYTLLPLYAESSSSGAPAAGGSTDAGPAEGASVQVIEPVEECEATPAPGDCDGNTAPVLRNPLYVVNDLLVPDLSDVRNGDVLAVLVEFEDAQCNLACGTNWSSSEGGDSAASAPSNIPCDTEASGLHLGLYVGLTEHSGPGVQDLPPEHHLYRLGVTDRCGARSEPVVVEFDVTFSGW